MPVNIFISVLNIVIPSAMTATKVHNDRPVFYTSWVFLTFATNAYIAMLFYASSCIW